MKTSGIVQGGSLAVTNIGSADLILQPGTQWVTTDTVPSFADQPPTSLGDTALGHSVTKQLVITSCKIEELFEHKYRVVPSVNMYNGYQLAYNVSVSENIFAPDPSAPISTWEEEIINNVTGDEESNIRPTEHIHAAAKMVFAVMSFRASLPNPQLGGTRQEPADSVKLFIYQIAKAFVLEGSEMPEEALGKMSLLTL